MIYLIRAEKTNLYKIGYTAGKVESRVKGLQTGCPYKISIIRELTGDQAKEKRLHNIFSEFRKEGEWFEFNKETLDEVEKEMFSTTAEEWDIIELESTRDMYEDWVRTSDSSSGHLDRLIDLGILEIMCGRHDVAIQRLLEFKSLVFYGSRLKIIPPLTEKIRNTDKNNEGE